MGADDHSRMRHPAVLPVAKVLPALLDILALLILYVRRRYSLSV